ncbi:MAG: hypothetical protein EPO07_17290 [Verrucomicrobia bacterium]|nr:MAG: hypothetical protein EPO07_17290 [Verrucomicrobiota bacterium]
MMGQTLASWPMSTNGLDRVEVTSIAKTEIAGDDLLSFGLLIANPFSDTVYSFNSRETSAGLRPQFVLESTNGSLSYVSWVAGFTNLSSSAPGADPDGDRLNNAEEFLFARNPGQVDGSNVFAISVAPGGVTLGFPQRKHLPAQTYFVVESTTSLMPATWLPAPGVEFSPGVDLGAARWMNAFIPASDSTQSFYRLRIVIGP